MATIEHVTETMALGMGLAIKEYFSKALLSGVLLFFLMGQNFTIKNHAT